MSAPGFALRGLGFGVTALDKTYYSGLRGGYCAGFRVKRLERNLLDVKGFEVFGLA